MTNEQLIAAMSAAAKELGQGSALELTGLLWRHGLMLFDKDLLGTRLEDATILLEQVSIGYAETGSNPRMHALVKAFLSRGLAQQSEVKP